MKKTNSILIVEDERYEKDEMEKMLQNHPYRVHAASNTTEALRILEKNEIDVVLLDIYLKDKISGIDFINVISENVPHAQIIMITSNNSMDTIIEAIKSGAFYYMIKPVDEKELLILIDRALKHGMIKKENILNDAYLKHSHLGTQHCIIGSTPGIIDLKAKIKKISESMSSDVCVLLRGESGTGKEVFARYLNSLNAKNGRNSKFIDVNCASISKGLFESEFFGHEKGAFTGADKRRTGFFEMAEGGDIFLDEIGDLPLEFQAKLLRVLQEKRIRYVGGTRDIAVNFRLISATNADLKQMVREKTFRKDLYFRIKVVELYIPPLSERKEDIPLLVEHFMKSMFKRMNKEFKPLDNYLLDLLTSHNWPGNIRELKNTLESLVILGFNGTNYNSDILLDSIYQNRIDDPQTESGQERPIMIERFINNPIVMNMLNESTRKKHLDLQRLRMLFEKSIIQTVLEDCDNNLSSAAKILGIARTTLHYKLKGMESN